ncbi:hypothetical protein [Mammaliicoccus sciuri]|uniref:hypothetical protein n=1 Tax=Mammaliicoccus sciuri TaxID=1296 RepID=UPI001E304D91|nr:hypothetical protein [Mammaliicoccus sciuri]MCD8824076.1 hypothetical protein [Mammaliicoccus sciuri]
MSNTKFQFTKIPQIEVATFDRSLEKFYSNGIEGTIKENIQNSLDAKLFKNNEEPVRINIKLDEISKTELPGIDEVFQHIGSLQGANNYTKETVYYMQEKINIKKVPILTIEDSNTKGLTGAKNGQSNLNKDTFGIYAYKKGVHFVDDSDSIEISRGGSHGIGKIANNAASDINLMYFANCDAEGNQHIGGTVHLIEHNLDGIGYRSTGYFSDIDINQNNKLIPFENYNNHPIFEKSTRGLKIIIPYLRKEFYDRNNIIRAVCDNFFLAILNKSIVVDITDQFQKQTIINNETIKEIMQDEELYETKLDEMKKIFTPLYVNTYLNSIPQEIEVKNNSESYKFNLYFYYDENITVGRVAILRTIGMKIVDFKVPSRFRKPFNAVLIGGSKEDKYLKTLENESHTDISESDIRGEVEKKNARKFIRNLGVELKKIIDDSIDKNNPTDGFINTDDLFFETENFFKNEFSYKAEKVVISEGKELLKVNQKERRDSGDSIGKKNSKNKVRDRVPKKVKNDQESNNNVYITPSDAVERISLKNEEYLNISLIKEVLNKHVDVCNLIIKVVDGNGMTIGEEYKILENYKEVLDLQSNSNACVSENKIKNVSIIDGSIKLKLLKKDEMFNKLKFIYILEVNK